MTLWRRAPREVYRVYGEEEYLGGDAPSAVEESHQAPVQEHAKDHYAVVGHPAYRAQAGRLVGLGLLVGVVVSAAALVVLNVAHRPPTAPPATVARVAHAHGAARASSGAAIDGGSPVSVSKNPTPRVRARTRTRARVGAHSSTGHPSGGRSSTRQAHRSAESVSEAASAEWSAPPRSTTSDPAPSGAEAPPIGGEFEFER